MPSVSEVTICNKALGWVGGNRITSLDDATTEAALCKDNYEDLRDAVLESADWAFAMGRFTPAPSASTPTFEYAYKFAIPVSQFVRISSVSDDPMYENNIPWVREEDYILCDSSVIYVKAVKKIIDPTRFSPLFVQALAGRIAADLAIPIAQSRQLQADMWALYEKKVSEAKNSDSLQGRSKKVTSNWLTNARNR